MVADASGADVAASVNTTGFDGDWILEYNHGMIESAAIAVDGYDYPLTSTWYVIDSGAIRTLVQGIAATCAGASGKPPTGMTFRLPSTLR